MKKNPNAGIILPDLKNINNTNNFKNYNNINIKNSQNIYLRSVSTDKAKFQQNTNNITNDTSAFTHSSKKKILLLLDLVHKIIPRMYQNIEWAFYQQAPLQIIILSYL